MVEKVKQDICSLVNDSNDYELLDLIWRLLCKSIDRECSPYELMTDEERGVWEWLKGKARSKQK